MFRINITKKNNSYDKAVAYSNDDNRRPLKNSASPLLRRPLCPAYRKHRNMLLLFKELRNARYSNTDDNIPQKW